MERVINYLDNTMDRKSVNNFVFSKYLSFIGINFCFPLDVPDLHKPHHNETYDNYFF